MPLSCAARGRNGRISSVDSSNRKAVESDRVGWASRTPAETHLDILHAQDVPTIIHVLLEVFVLDAGETEG